MTSFRDKPVCNISMHEIDVRKLHNNVQSKYTTLIGSTWRRMSVRYTPVGM